MLATDRSATAVAVEALHDPDAGVRRVAACVLGEAGSPEVSAALVATLGDEDAGVRANAVRSLTGVGGDAALAVTQRLSDPDRIVRLAALDAVATAERRASDAVPAAIRPLLRDDDPGVRRRAAGVLVARTGDAEARERNLEGEVAAVPLRRSRLLGLSVRASGDEVGEHHPW